MMTMHFIVAVAGLVLVGLLSGWIAKDILENLTLIWKDWRDERAMRKAINLDGRDHLNCDNPPDWKVRTNVHPIRPPSGPAVIGVDYGEKDSTVLATVVREGSKITVMDIREYPPSHHGKRLP